MRTTTALWFIFSTVLVSTSLLACGDDDVSTPAGSGSGATAGTAGAAGTGGSSGSSGDAGTAGSNGGTSNGGSSGNAGTAGVGGSSGSSGTGGGGTGGTGGGGTGGGGTAGVGGTAGSSGTGGSIGGSAGSGGSMPVITGSIRLANLPITDVNVHVCAAVAGSNNFTLISSDWSNGAAISANTVTAYFPIEIGVYDFAVVDSADVSCSTPLFAANATILENSLHTLVFSGDLGNPDIRAYEDRTTTDPSTGFARMIHADPLGDNLTLGSYLGLLSMPPAYTSWTILFGNVSAADGIAAENMGFPGVDALGYAPISLPIPGNTPLELRYAHNGARAGTFVDSAVELNLGDNATLFVHSFNGTRVTHWCKDSAPAVSGNTDCVEITEIPGDTPPLSINAMAPAPFGGVRFAHMSPEATAPAVDVCIKPSYFSEWLPDDSQVWTTLNYKQVTGDLDVPFESGYDIKLITHDPNGPANCQNPAVDPVADLPAVAVDETTQSTWALLGSSSVPGYALTISTFTNQIANSVLSPSIRYINGTAAIAQANVGQVGGMPLWAGTSFASAGATVEVSLSPNQMLGIDYVGNSTYDLKTAPLTAQQIPAAGRPYSLWSTGALGGMPGPLFVLCDEDPTVALQSCVELPLAPP